MNSKQKPTIMSPLEIPRLSPYWTKQKPTTHCFSDLHHSTRAQEEVDMPTVMSELKNRVPMELIQQHELADAKMVLFEEHLQDRRTHRWRKSRK